MTAAKENLQEDIIIKKSVLREHGANAAIVLGQIRASFIDYRNKGELEDIDGREMFYLAASVFYKELKLGRTALNSAVDVLIEAGLIVRELVCHFSAPYYTLTEEGFRLYGMTEEIDDDQGQQQEESVQESAGMLAEDRGATCSSYQNNNPLKQIDEEYIYTAPRDKKESINPIRKEIISRGMNTLADRVRHALGWSDKQIEKLEAFLANKTEWAGIFVESAFDRVLKKLWRAEGNVVGFFARALERETETMLSVMNAEEYAAAKEQEQQRSGRPGGMTDAFRAAIVGA